MAFDTTKPAIDAITPSKFPFSMLDQPENHFAGTRLPILVPRETRFLATLRDASQRHDGEMLTPAAVLDVQLDRDSWSSSHERMQRSARRPSRPPGSRFVSRSPASRECAEVDFVGCARSEARVRPLGVVPGDVVVELAAERVSRQRNDRQQARALVLHRLDEPLDDGEAAVLADGAEALLDAATDAEGPELLRCELNAVIGDQVSGPTLDPSAHSAEEGRHVARGRLLLEPGGPDGSPREVIDNDGDPPTKWPALRQRKWQPGDPEAAEGWDGGQVDVPNVVRNFRCEGSWLRGSTRFGRRFRCGLRHATHGGRAEMKTGACQDAGDAASSHLRTEHRQPLHEVADERIRPFAIESLSPGRDRQRGDEEASRGFCLRPGPRGTQRQNRESLIRRIVRPVLGWEALLRGEDRPHAAAGRFPPGPGFERRGRSRRGPVRG